ncbi:MAG TPA: putative baseplate assembly protein [Nocardioidaceae bacterium]
MPTPEPPLVDPRSVEHLVARLAARARETVPQWRPPPDGDVGSALQLALAGMVGELVTRVNRVPDHAFTGFLDATGQGPLPPSPARGVVALALSAGAGATVVPARAALESLPVAGRPPVAFETEQAVSVLPLAVAAVEVADPDADRCSVLGDGSPERVLAGRVPVAHALEVLTSCLRAADTTAQVSVRLDLTGLPGAPAPTPAAVRDAVEGTTVSSAVAPGPQTTTLAVPSQGAATATVSSTWPSGPTEALRLDLPGPLAQRPGGRGLILTALVVSVDVPPRPPRAVAVSGSPVDPTLAFEPFGAVPAPGSELALADPVLATPGAVLTLAVGLDPGTTTAVTLAWEWFDGSAWHALPGVSDGTSAFTKQGSVAFSSPGVPEARYAGVAGCWVRVRVTAGGYGAPARYVPVDNANLGAGLKLATGTGNLDAPRVTSLTLAAHAEDQAPAVARVTGERREPALGTTLAASLADLDGPDGAPAPCLMIGLDGDPGTNQVTLHLDLDHAPALPRGAGRSAGTSLHWEYTDGVTWRALTVVDGTHGLSRSGIVSFLAPPTLAPLELPGRPPLRWVRAVADEPVVARDCARLRGVTPNVVAVVAGASVAWEPLGQADGRASAVHTLSTTPVLAGEQVLLAEQGSSAPAEGHDGSRTWIPWTRVESLTTSGPTDRHYLLDRTTGAITFGDGQRGMIPPRGSAVAAVYRHGGGADGNLPASALGRLRDAVPGIARVWGVQPTTGGAASGSTALRRRLGPAALRHRGRAVTSADLCAIADEVTGGSLARCIVPTDVPRGSVVLVVVPHAPRSASAPAPGPELCAFLEQELVARSPVAVGDVGSIRVTGPAYRRVDVVADVVPRHPEDAEQVKAACVAGLARFLDAVDGGPAGGGWPLGRDVFESEVAQVLMAMTGVASVQSLRLLTGAATARLTLAAPLVLEFGARTGALARSADGRLAWTLDESVLPGAPAGSLVLRGPTENDLLQVIEDVVAGAHRVLAEDEAEVDLRWVSGHGAGVFPSGSTLVAGVGADTRTVLTLNRPAVAGGDDVVARGRLEGAAPAPGEQLALVHPEPLLVTDVAPLAGGGHAVQVVGEVLDQLVPGCAVGVLGHPGRTRVKSVVGPDLGARTARLVTSGWQAGDAVWVSDDAAASSDGGHEPQQAWVVAAEEVDDVVHLDRTSLVRSGDHVVRVVAQG